MGSTPKGGQPDPRTLSPLPVELIELLLALGSRLAPEESVQSALTVLQITSSSWAVSSVARYQKRGVPPEPADATNLHPSPTESWWVCVGRRIEQMSRKFSLPNHQKNAKPITFLKMLKIKMLGGFFIFLDFPNFLDFPRPLRRFQGGQGGHIRTGNPGVRMSGSNFDPPPPPRTFPEFPARTCPGGHVRTRKFGKSNFDPPPGHVRPGPQ